ncbi:MAG: hypothetical protein NT080_08795 [Spirochaetes bacterium]|nr:hypothetical protein [Spirochaetota bacterium]
MKGDEGKKDKGVSLGKVIGWGFIAFGVVSMLDSFSPIPVPTVGPVAILSGLAFVGIGGLFLLRGAIPWSKLLSGSATTLFAPSVKIDPMLPVRILKLAKDHAGILTVSMVAIELNIPIDVAEAGLEECARHGHAAVDFDMQKETKYYSFHEHLKN